jgi:hypothetical protein
MKRFGKAMKPFPTLPTPLEIAAAISHIPTATTTTRMIIIFPHIPAG